MPPPAGRRKPPLVAVALEVGAKDSGTLSSRKMACGGIDDAGAVKVETLNGTVALSGFAKSSAEKAQAEFLARNTKGVREVRNNLAVRP